MGRPPEKHPRGHVVSVRFSDTEWGALVRALAAEYPGRSSRPPLSEWIRDFLIAHATDALGVQVTRAGIRHERGGVPDFKRWKIDRAVKRAAGRRRRRRDK